MAYTLKQMSPQLLVADLERAITFYTTQLGFDIDFRYEDFYAGVIKNGYSIHLKWDDHATASPAYRKNEGHLDLTFAVTDIEAIYEQITASGVTIIQPLREMPYGTEFYIADPDGHVIAFLE